MITPYAIGNQPTLPSPPPQYQLPSTSKSNLPDVLSQSQPIKPTTNVKKIAEKFANNPNFHITRSPNTNRKIPQYTIPNKIGAASNKLNDYRLPNNNDSDSSNSHSDHSGGSDITFKMDEIEFADA